MSAAHRTPRKRMRRSAHRRHSGNLEVLQHATHCKLCRVWLIAQLAAALKVLRKMQAEGE